MVNDYFFVSMQVLIQTPTSSFWVIENFTPDYYEYLRTLPVLEEPPIMVYGRMAKQNRDIAFFSDESKGYKYSNQIMHSTPLSLYPFLVQLLAYVNHTFNTNFNGILLNRYKDGSKSLGAHSDDEKGLDKSHKLVLGLSYGPGIRKFRIRNKQSKDIVLDYEQKPGTLIAMQGDFQSEFTHEIPVQRKIKGERISLTFRHHLE